MIFAKVGERADVLKARERGVKERRRANMVAVCGGRLVRWRNWYGEWAGDRMV